MVAGLSNFAPPQQECGNDQCDEPKHVAGHAGVLWLRPLGSTSRLTAVLSDLLAG